MKQNTDQRLNKAKQITKEELVNKIKESDTTRFDQMLIEQEERKTYFFVKYNSVAFSRKPKTLNFPLFKDLVNDFERNIENNGDIKILENDTIINKIKGKGKQSIDTPKYSGKNLVFNDLKIVTDNDKITLKQPLFYIPNETERCTCNTCNGDMYNTCNETECHGQHIYDCNKCEATGSVDCSDCKGQGEKKCSTCSGSGRIKCKGYVSSGGTSGAASNAVYSCSNGKATCRSCFGKGCYNCKKTGKATCPTCNGVGTNPCSKKYNSSYGIGKVYDSIGGVDFCEGSGKIACKSCNSKGKVKCKKCQGNGRIECKTCYGDYTDNRYGKVDCYTCETAGELASISYIETEIKIDDLELICTDGNQINAPNFGVETIKKYTNNNNNTILTYKSLNGDSNENYNEYSSFASKNAMTQVGINKDKYPKILVEELYVEGVPCVTINYNHILTATYHDVSVLSIDNEKDVLFHSNPEAVMEEKETLKQKINELCLKAFSTKSFRDKIDRKHEMFLMIHMAKADGIVEEQEKKYLAKNISGLDGFTMKEKAALFGLMSASILPLISPSNAYFSSKERAEIAKSKIIELVGKADGNYEPIEKAKLEEINTAIELGYKAKPSTIGQFFKTWQISASLVIILSLLSFLLYFSLVLLPIQNAKSLHNDLLVNQTKLEYFLSSKPSKTTTLTDTIYDVFEAEKMLEELTHNSDLTFLDNGKEVSYLNYWKSKQTKLQESLKIYLETHKVEKQIDVIQKPEEFVDDNFVETQDEIMVEGIAEKIYFYDRPDSNYKTKSYFIKGQTAKLLGGSGNYSKVSYTNNDRTTEKYVLTDDITEIVGNNDGGISDEEQSEQENLDPQYK